MGFVFSDFLTNYERVADHCSNIAVCLIQVEQNSFDTHEYLNSIKTSENQEYLELYEMYKEKYTLHTHDSTSREIPPQASEFVPIESK